MSRSIVTITLVSCLLVGGVTAKAMETSAAHCYRCRSQNFTDRACHDPFTEPLHRLTENCLTAVGTTLFPASYCIKVHGISEITGEEFVIRDCVMEQPDEECSVVHVRGDRIQRCIWWCEGRGCNGGDRVRATGWWTVCVTAVTAMLAV